MEYLGAVYQQEGGGVAFRGKVGARCNELLVLCGIRRGEAMDRELSAYVTRRIEKWAERMQVTEDAPEAFQRELAQIEAELKHHAVSCVRKKLPGEIQWEYLAVLLCKDTRGFLVVKGASEVWVCNCSMGHKVKDKLLPAGQRDSCLVEIQGEVGVLLSAGPLSEHSSWQELLTPGGLHSREMLQRRLKELVVYGGEQSYGLGYLLAKENRNRRSGECISGTGEQWK